MKSLYILLFSTLTSFGQDTIPCKCCTPEHQQFDFWIGDWNVYDTAATLIGINTILKLQEGCTLQENWAAQMTGTSYNYYNKTDSTWNQVWVDNQGGSLVLKGNYINGSMVLKGELQPEKNVDFYYNQITWTPNPDGSVTQKWDVFDKNGTLLTNAFLGNYVLKP